MKELPETEGQFFTNDPLGITPECYGEARSGKKKTRIKRGKMLSRWSWFWRRVGDILLSMD